MESEEEIDENDDDYTMKTHKFKFSDREAVFMAAALEDGIKQMLLLSSCYRGYAKNVKKDQASMESLEENFEDENKFSSDMYKLTKMNNDRDYVRDLLIKMYLDFKINRSYASFLTHFGSLSTKTYQYISEELSYKENKCKMKTLQEELKHETKKIKSEENDLDEQINSLRDEIDDMVWNCDIKIDYATKWQNARLQQFELRMEKIETKSKENLLNMKLKIENEMKVNNEICRFIDVITQDLVYQLKIWIKRYNSEYEHICKCIEKLTEKRRIQTENIEAVTKLLADHKAEMDDWCETVLQRKLAEERRILEYNSATKIQAWWRGISFRKKLAEKSAKRKSAKKKKK